MARNYNYIYSQLVEDENDIIGHIAYALYKSDKISYIGKFKSENGGKEPEEADLKSFHDTSSLPTQLERYRVIAVIILRDFTNETLKEMIHDIEEETINNHKESLSDIIKPIKPKSLGNCYFHGIAQSILGGIALMAILCLFIFILKFSETKYTFTFGGDGSTSLQQHEVTQTDSISIRR